MKKTRLILGIFISFGLFGCGNRQAQKDLRFTLFDDGYCLIGIDGGSDIVNITDLHVPSSYKGKPVVRIGSEAFSSFKCLKNVTLPNTVTSIGRQAFYNCISLKNISIPNSIVNIEDFAFQYCDSLTNLG